MNVPDLLRQGGWRQGHSGGGKPYWEHERYGVTRWETHTAVADELAHVVRQRDTLQARLDRAVELLDEAAPALREGAALLRAKAVASRPEPHWLVKDFSVLYSAARQFSRAIDGHWLDERAEAARIELTRQLVRLQGAFAGTEGVRAELARPRESRDG